MSYDTNWPNINSAQHRILIQMSKKEFRMELINHIKSSVRIFRFSITYVRPITRLRKRYQWNNNETVQHNQIFKSKHSKSSKHGLKLMLLNGFGAK